MTSSTAVLDYLKLPEDEYHDFKQRWHNDNSELVRDILNFVNTVHHDDCYIFFGVADDGTIIGVNEDINRKDIETLTDLLHKLYLSTNSQIKVKVDTQLIEDKEIDILTIFDTNLVPIYLTKEYKPKGTKGLSAGLVYSRNGAINTPRNESTSFEKLNSLFKKYNKMDTSIQERYKQVLTDNKNWSYIENDEGTFFIYNLNPDFYMRFYVDTQNRYQVDAYSLNQMDCKISWYVLEIRYRHLTIFERLLNFLDGGRVLVPSPNLTSFESWDRGGSYYYIFKDSLDYLLLTFLAVVFPVIDSYSLQRFKESVVILENKEVQKRLHDKVNSIYSIQQIQELTTASDIDSYYEQHIAGKISDISISEMSYMLRQKKITDLLNRTLSEKFNKSLDN